MSVDPSDASMESSERQRLKSEYVAIFQLAQNDPSGFLLERAKEYRKRLNKDNPNAFESAADAQDFWNKALRENEFWSNLQFSEQAAATNLADSTMAGEVKARIGDKRLAIESRAAQIGVELAEETLVALSDQAYRENWGGLDIESALQAQVDEQLAASEDNLGFTGSLGAAASELSAWSRRNGLEISQADADSLLSSVSFQNMTLDEVKSQLRSQYMVGAYPAWAEQIQNGYDIYDLSSPYRGVAERMLGRTSGSLAMTDPILKEMMQYQDANGQIRIRPLYEAEEYIRGLDEWQGSPDAQQTYARTVSSVGRMFGFG